MGYVCVFFNFWLMVVHSMVITITVTIMITIMITIPKKIDLNNIHYHRR